MAVSCNLAALQIKPISSTTKMPSLIYTFPPKLRATWFITWASRMWVFNVISTFVGTRNGSFASFERSLLAGCAVKTEVVSLGGVVSSSLPSSADSNANSSSTSVLSLSKVSSPSSTAFWRIHLPIFFSSPVRAKSLLPITILDCSILQLRLV